MREIHIQCIHKIGFFYALMYLSYNYSAENAMIVHSQPNKAIGGFIFSEMILYGLSRLSSLSPFFEDQLKVSGTILGLYILGGSLYNIIKMRKAEKDKVAIKDIAVLLQRTDIDIE